MHGCPVLFPATEGTRCPAHRREADRKHWEATRGYNTSGHRKRFRPAVLERQPVCVKCGRAPSVVADHYPLSRRELEARGLDPDDPRFGRGLCAPCHSSETAQHQPGGWHAR